jgi:hypothetical protein
MNEPVFRVDRVRAANSRRGDGGRICDFPGCPTVKLSRDQPKPAARRRQPRTAPG